MDDGRLALVQAGHRLTRVTEDMEDLGLAEAHVQPLVHLLHHLACCRAERWGGRSASGFFYCQGSSQALPLQYSMRIRTSHTLSDTTLMVESR